MRRSAIFIRGARVMATVRARLSREMPKSTPAPQPRDRFFDAGPHARASVGVPRVGYARDLLGPLARRLFRARAQSSRDRDDSIRIYERERLPDSRSAGNPRRVREGEPGRYGGLGHGYLQRP